MKPLLTIITVNYNNCLGLADTIESVGAVIKYNHIAIEYIVIDGFSNDGSIELIKDNSSLITNNVVEEDNGVYYAMNKGIKLSHGRWICMMNSGDTFSPDLDLSFLTDIDEKKLMIYGDWIKNNSRIKPKKLSTVLNGIIPICHQAAFFDKSLFYDVSYRIYADFELVVRLYKTNKQSLQYIDEVFAIYEGGGLSDRPSWIKRYEKFVIVYRNFGLKQLIKSLNNALYNKFF